MRICYIGDGDSVHNHIMIDWFQKRGHDILFITDTPNENISCETVQVVKRKGLWGFRHLLAILRTRKEIKRWNPDIVHAHILTGYGYWGAFCGFSPFISTAWGSDVLLLPLKSRIVYYLIYLCLKKSRFVTGDAKSLCDKVRKIAGKQLDVRLLQWGVDLQAFDRVYDEDLIRQYRKNAEFVFISTRRLRPVYNIHIIILAYSTIVEEFPNSRLLIVGEDFLTKTLKGTVERMNLTQHVIFTGWIQRDEMISLLKGADAFLSVPSSDSTALSLLEAFAARLPVIVSNVRANLEWVEAYTNGLVVLPGELDMLAESMRDMINHPERGKAWGEYNRKLVESRGERNQEMKKLEAWYAEVVAEKS